MDESEPAGGPKGDGQVQVAYAPDLAQAEMIQGLLESGGIGSYLKPIGLDSRAVGSGLLGSGPRGVVVRADQEDAARRLLDETLVEEPPEDVAEIANARHLEDAQGRKPRGYGVAGAYARIYLWSFAAIGLVLAVFLLSR